MRLRLERRKLRDRSQNAFAVQEPQNFARVRDIALNSGGRQVFARQRRDEVFQHDGVNFVERVVFEEIKNQTLQPDLRHDIRVMPDFVAFDLF